VGNFALRLVRDAPSSPEEGTTSAMAFEALFLRGLEASEDLRLALGGIGVELDALEPRYPSAVWIAAIDLARSYLAGASGDSEATERRLGRACFDGALRTLSGRLLAVTIPLMSVRSLLARAELYLRMARDDLWVDFDEGASGYRLRVTDPATARPQFFSGLLEGAMSLVGKPCAIAVEQLDEHRFEVRVTVTGG
jgi:uncharacterized protein (TIGR02265 family)